MPIRSDAASPRRRPAVAASPVLVALLWATGCAHKPLPEIVWPDPPDTARIRFVRAFSDTADLDQSAWGRFGRALAGGDVGPRLGQPTGLAISDDGRRLYIADNGTGGLLVADFAGNRLKDISPEPPLGRAFGVALDRAENVYVTDSLKHEVVVLDNRGRRLRAFGRGDLERPTGIAVDGERGQVYVSDSASRESLHHRVRAFNLEGKWLFDLGPRAHPPTKGQDDGQLYFPVYVAVARNGEVLVGDTMNFRIQVFSPNGQYLRKFGKAGDGPGTFNRLKGIATDGFGDIYVVDGGHSNVQIFNGDFQPLMFFGGYAPTPGYFDIPSGIAIHRATNRIYVCNEYFARINVYDLINTRAGDATPGASPTNGASPKSTP